MGRLERRIDPAALARALARNPQPHVHASSRGPIAPCPPLPRQAASDRWPTPQYVEHKKAREYRRKLRQAFQRDLAALAQTKA
jgi:hypothetical protein